MTIQLTPLGTFATGIFDESAAEIVSFDPATQRLFVVNANNAAVDVLDISNPSAPTLAFSIDVTPFGSVANSVFVANGIVAVAVENDNTQAPGTVAFFDANGAALNAVGVGALPDNLVFTPDGERVLVSRRTIRFGW